MLGVFSVVGFTASIKTVLNVPWWAAALMLAVIVAAGLMGLGYWHQRKHPSISDTVDAGDPLGSVRGYAARAGGGAYVGVREQRLVFSAPQRAVLLLGPPRSGKTSSVIIPSILCHHGPVLSTSGLSEEVCVVVVINPVAVLLTGLRREPRRGERL